VTNQEKTVEHLRDALQKEDYVGAEIIAHSAKGVSGNIGATQLQDMAYELETRISNKTPISQMEDKLSLFEKVQSSLIQALKNAFPTTTPQIIQNVDITSAPDVFNRLISLLEDQDHSAVRYFEKNSALLQSALGDEIFSTVKKQIKQYDFEATLQLLRKVTTLN
jgi:HPt (histidine-containing phosphotransfer) domain-containing protein